MLCDIAKVSRAGYYKWLGVADLKDKDHEVYLKIKEIFDKSGGRFGWRSIKMRLEAIRISLCDQRYRNW